MSNQNEPIQELTKGIIRSSTSQFAVSSIDFPRSFLISIRTSSLALKKIDNLLV